MIDGDIVDAVQLAAATAAELTTAVEPTTAPTAPTWRSAAAGIAICAALFATRPVVEWWFYGKPGPAIDGVALPAVVIIATAGLFTVALRWGKRRRLAPATQLIAAYVFTAAVIAALAVGYDALAASRPWMGPPDPLGLPASAYNGAYSTMLVLGVWLLVHVMPRVMREAYERERERHEQRQEIERARLRATLEPHFVLNTLNTISGLLGEQPETARDLIGDLGDLLRDVVRLADRPYQPVGAEIAWLERYARVLEARHAGRLAVTWDVEPAACAAAMPVLLLQPLRTTLFPYTTLFRSLLLQPLLENAVQHGALQRPTGGRVDVAVRLVDGRLRCTIDDNGPGMPAEVRAGARGLDLTRRRLACDVPGAALTIATHDRGTRVELALPVEAT